MNITPEFAEQFFAALASRDPVRIAPFVADDAEWLIVGPIELFPYCGQHLGKEAVLDAYTQMGERTQTRAAIREFVVTGEDCISALTRLTMAPRDSRREATFRLAQFARIRDGKVYEFCSITDTLGVAEQLLGHTLVEAPALVD
jgi:ketosteroid isomerase-like protein